MALSLLMEFFLMGGQRSGQCWSCGVAGGFELAKVEAVPPTCGEFAKINTLARAQNHMSGGGKQGRPAMQKRNYLFFCVCACILETGSHAPSNTFVPTAASNWRLKPPKSVAHRLMTESE